MSSPTELDGAAASRARALLVAAVLAVLAALFAPAAFYRLFSTFKWWDDEGYMMISIASHARGQPLYDSVGSLYGPFYFLASWLALHVPGVRLEHATVRYIVGGLWLASALFGAGIVYRCTRNVSATALAFVVLALVLASLASEPGHPHGLVVLLLCGSAFLCGFWRAESARRIVPVLGVIAAALFLTKINIGSFFVASIGLALLAFTRLEGRARLVQPIAWLIALLLPVALMRDHLAEDARPYCLAVVATVATVGGVLLASRREPLFRPRDLLVFAGSFLAAASVFCAFVLLRGSSFRGLLEGVVLQHLDAARVYYTALDIEDAALAGSAVSVVLAIAHLALLRIGGRAASVDSALIAAVRIAFGWIVFDRALALDYAGLLVRAAPFLWISMIAPAPPGELNARTDPKRAFLASIAMLQTLQAYPVVGSQTAWSAMLLIPASAVSLADALSILARPLQRIAPERLWTAIRWTAVAVSVAVAINLCRRETELMRGIFERNVRLELPGTGPLRVAEKDCAAFHWLASNLRNRTFYSLPGLNSLYFWTATSPPTENNVSFGWFFLSRLAQHEIVERLERTPDLVIVHGEQCDLLTLQEDGREWPLLQYVRERFEPVAHVGPYDLRLRPGETLATTYRARLEESAISLEIPPLRAQALEGVIVTPAGSGEYVGIVDYLTEQMQQRAGKSQLPAVRRMSAPVDLSHASRIVVPCSSEEAQLIRAVRYPVARLYDAGGKVIASLPFER